MTVSAVLFDMDGLLLDTERVCLTSFVETRRQFSLSDDVQTYMRCVGLRREMSDRIVRESLGNQVAFEEFSVEWERRIESQLENGIPVKAGAPHLLNLLTQRGLPLGVATSTHTVRATHHLKESDLLGYFDCVIGGDQVSKPKPDPEVYLAAAERLGVDIGSCVVFEDSDTGTRAAVASGARVVQVPDLIAPSTELRKLGHLIADNLLEGAVMAGLLAREETVQSD